MTRLRLAVAALALLGFTDPTAADAPIGKWGITRYDAISPACHSVDDLGRYYELSQSGDTEAANSFVAERCAWMAGGTDVMVEDSSWKGALCVRPRGSPDCLWVPSDAVEVGADADRAKAAKRAADDEDKAFTAKLKAIDDDFNQRFDKEHPECSGWRTNKHLRTTAINEAHGHRSNPRPSAAPPVIGARFITTKPARSKCSTSRLATIAEMSSSASRTRLRP